MARIFVLNKKGDEMSFDVEQTVTYIWNAVYTNGYKEDFIKLTDMRGCPVLFQKRFIFRVEETLLQPAKIKTVEELPLKIADFVPAG